MLRKIYLITLLASVLLFLNSNLSFSSQIDDAYYHYLELGKKSLSEKSIKEAIFYFDTAHKIDPDKSDARYFLDLLTKRKVKSEISNTYKDYAINALKRKDFKSALEYFNAAFKENPNDPELIRYIIKLEVYTSKLQKSKEAETNYTEKLDYLDLASIAKKEEISYAQPVQEDFVENKFLQHNQEEVNLINKYEKLKIYDLQSQQNMTDEVFPISRNKDSEKIGIISDQVLELNDELWKFQPNHEIEIKLKSKLTIVGNDMRRFLVLNQDVISVSKLDDNQLVISPLKRGSSLLHIWDQTGRWTFNIKGEIPDPIILRKEKSIEEIKESYVENFKFAYSNNWSSFYSGDNFDNLSRQNLIYRQFIGLYGPTPYGKFDSSMSFLKFAESTEIVGQTIGLENAQIGPFKDFSIRGYDASKSFSPLSLPGRYFRGILLDAYAFNRKLKYSALKGQDIAVFTTVSQSVDIVRKSYIEGARFTFFPDSPNNYSLNYARGYGEIRAASLKDRVYSVDVNRKYNDWNVFGEVGYDEEDIAKIVNTKLRKDDYSLILNFRDIDKGYQTITGKPSGSGEVGADLSYSRYPKNSKLSYGFDLDAYRDRDLLNPENENGINFDLGTNVNYRINNSTAIGSSMFFIDTPQLLSPRKSFRLNFNLSKLFKILNDRTITTFVTTSFQQNRFKYSPSSEFDRYGITTGFRLPIIKNLSYFLNYEYSWVEETLSKNDLTPSVLNTGLSYTKQLTKALSSRVSITYRDEEKSEGSFSFLSGQDSLRGNIGLTYRPSSDLELFADCNLRNIWAENDSNDAFNDAEVRFGMQSTWDLMVGWNPLGVIRGTIYKDYNGNGLQDNGEPGIEGVTIEVGKKKYISSYDGKYYVKLRASEVLVRLDTSTIPKGFVVSTETQHTVNLEQVNVNIINFGLTVRSSISGIIYSDTNNNNSYDADEEVVPMVKLTMDGGFNAFSNHQGLYAFAGVEPGTHFIKIDLNSIPIKFVPKIKLSNEVVIQEGDNYKFNIPLNVKN